MTQMYDYNFIEQQLKDGGQLIDVRSPLEFSQGALEFAVNMPVDRFEELKDGIDNSKPVLLYCRSGARSEMVKKYLQQIGFDHVHNLGGINRFING